MSTELNPNMESPEMLRHTNLKAQVKGLMAALLMMGVMFTSFEAAAACRGAWAEGVTYAAGDTVTYNGSVYTARSAHGCNGCGWNPVAAPSLWALGGTCGTTPTPTVRPTVTPTVRPTVTPTVRPTVRPTPTPTVRPTVTPTTSPCNPAWSASAVYTGGQRVTHNGVNYEAKWWTQGNDPSTNSCTDCVWRNIGNCGTGPSPTTRPTPTPTVRPTVTPTPTPTTTATPIPPGPGGIPRHAMIGYWHNFVNGSTNLRISQVPNAYDVIIVAFAESTATPGAITFNVDPGLSTALGGYTNSQMIADMNAKRAAGKKILLSIGGERGNVDVSQVTNFVNSFVTLKNTFGFDGLDVDLEHGMNVQGMANIITQLRSRFPGLLITMAPQTIDMQTGGGTYLQLVRMVRSHIAVVHMQYYNSGAMLGRDGKVYSQGTIDFLTALADLSLMDLSPDQVALGVPATPQAAGGGYQSPANVNAALNCLARGTNCGTYRPVALYPNIRGAMTWSINWDVFGNSTWSNTVRSGLNSLP
jgi:chitinase